MAVAEVLLDVSRNFPDPFLQEMALKTWRRSGRLLVLEQLDKVRLILWCLKILFHLILFLAHNGPSVPCLPGRTPPGLQDTRRNSC